MAIQVVSAGPTNMEYKQVRVAAIHSPSKSNRCSRVNLPSCGAKAVAPSAPILLPAHSDAVTIRGEGQPASQGPTIARHTVAHNRGPFMQQVACKTATHQHIGYKQPMESGDVVSLPVAASTQQPCSRLGLASRYSCSSSTQCSKAARGEVHDPWNSLTSQVQLLQLRQLAQHWRYRLSRVSTKLVD